MTARDWAGFGDYLMTQMENETCLGAFFKEGIENAVSTSKKMVLVMVISHGYLT